MTDAPGMNPCPFCAGKAEMSNLGKAAQPRRFYHHVLNGGELTSENVSLMVQTIEELEAENARNNASIDALKLGLNELAAIAKERADRIEELEAENARMVVEKNRAIADSLEADMMREKEKRRAEAAEAKLATIDMDVLARVEAKLSAVLEACDRAKMHPRPGCGAGGMTIEANIRGSVYSGVDAWPVEEARDAHDDFRAMMEKINE